jgi:hypothetical protein
VQGVRGLALDAPLSGSARLLSPHFASMHTVAQYSAGM